MGVGYRLAKWLLMRLLFALPFDDTTNAYEARLGWIVKLAKDVPFTGKAALQQIKAKGPERRLVGFVTDAKGVIPRHGMPVFVADRQVDTVRSGGYAPSLKQAIGTTYLPSHATEPGTAFEIEVRGSRVPARVVKMPFYAGGSVKR